MLAAAGALLLLSREAHAQPANAAESPEPRVAQSLTATKRGDSGFSERLILETSQTPPPVPDPESIGFSMHGEYQLRYRAVTDLRLEPPQGRPELSTLGQNHSLYHWFRLNPRLQLKDKVAVVGQIDVPRGFVVGDTTTKVSAARDAYSEPNWLEVHPRYLYLEYASPIGLVRAGQQGSHWGIGILANDGDHRTLFGDYQRGAIVERLLFASSPLGKDGPLTVAIAGDLVFEDNTADLIDRGDLALQAVLAAIFRTKRGEIGAYGVIRRQTRETSSFGEQTAFTEELLVGVADVTSKFNAHVSGTSAYVFGELEAAAIFGSTTFLRGAYGVDVTPGGAREPELIRSFGTAARLGAVHVTGRGRRRYGEVVVQVEWGYATGDANPYDGVSRRFTFDANHNVGLVLFDHVLAWKTARAATLAQDPALLRRAPPGVELLPSNGGVTGATYIYPTVVVRPKRWLDLKAGVVIAQATADVVDPYHAGALGDFASYDGGDERAHDLGLEIDLGADARVTITETMKVDLGVEGGVLFPGRAFDDARGQGLSTQALLNVKAGVNF